MRRYYPSIDLFELTRDKKNLIKVHKSNENWEKTLKKENYEIIKFPLYYDLKQVIRYFELKLNSNDICKF